VSAGYVYVIGPESGPYKIGKAASPEDRLRSLEIGSPVPLRLHFKVESERPVAAEAALHHRYRDRRLRGEWFDFRPEELAEVFRVAALQADIPPLLAIAAPKGDPEPREESGSAVAVKAPDAEDWVATAEAAALLGKTRRHVRNYCHRGLLRHRPFGRMLQVWRPDVEKMLRTREPKGPGKIHAYTPPDEAGRG
jgi:hypothetical protein